MATAIHHGPPGSFKSFTLIQRFAIPALLEGRTIVTNVRGFNDLDLVIEQFPEYDFPDTAQIIYVDCKSRENRALMARWFHWVPFRAVVIIDEVQQIYPMRRDFKMESLDVLDKKLLGGYVPEELPEPRPEDIFVAFEKQRHYNWDIYLSTPNIAKVKSDIREVAEWAYRHRNISGILPWKKDCWYEHQHDPESSGKSISHRVGAPNEYKADPRVYKCYASTATGEHTENQTGRSIFKDPKILLMLGVVGLCLVAFISLIVFKANDDGIVKTAPSVPASGVGSGSGPGAVVPVVVNSASVAPAVIKPTVFDYRAWSYAGIKPDDVPKLPLTCEIFHNHVVCPVSLSVAASISKNYYCVKDRCRLVFAFAAPEPEPDELKKLPS